MSDIVAKTPLNSLVRGDLPESPKDLKITSRSRQRNKVGLAGMVLGSSVASITTATNGRKKKRSKTWPAGGGEVAERRQSSRKGLHL